MGEICIKGMTLVEKKNLVRIEAEVSGAEVLWFEMEKKYQWMVDTESVDAFFILYVWLAMEMGSDLRVEGAVSKLLSDSVLNNVKNMFLVLCPRLTDINIILTKKTASEPNQLNNSATGFSGGVDGWYTALKAIEINEPYAYYLFANTGQHGKNNVEEVVAQRADVAGGALSSLNKPLIVINTNIDSVFRERFQQRDVLGNLACVLLIQEGISSYSYSSSYAPEDSKIIEHYDMSIMDPLLLPALSTERVEFKSIGLGATRIQKLQYISAAKDFSQKIYVCIEKDLPIKNCGYCFKCRRTQLALDSIGAIELIKLNFDYELYKRIRSFSFIGLLANSRRDNLDKEVADVLVKKYGLKIVHLRILGFFWASVRGLLPKGLKWRSMAKTPHLW